MKKFVWPIGPVLFVAKDHIYRIEYNTLKRFFSQGQSRKTLEEIEIAKPVRPSKKRYTPGSEQH